MAEYIEREAVIDLITRRYENPEICTQEINDIPSADVAPVRHGRWKLVGADKRGRGGNWECTGRDGCGKSYPYRCDYCPNCGALMKEAEHEAN